MPYKIKKEKGGFKVVSPNHKSGFSKKPQSLAKAKAQIGIIKRKTGE